MSISPLKIAVVSDAIRNRNGVGSYYQDLCEHLAPLVQQIKLFSPSQNQSDPYHGFRIPMPGDKTQHLYLPKWRKIYRELTQMNPDIMVLPSIGPFSLLGLLYAWRNGTPICVGHHTDFEQLARLYWHPSVSHFCQRFIRSLSGFLLRRGHAVVTNSIPMAKTANELGAKNVRLVGTPLTNDFVSTTTQSLRPELESVLFLGRLAKEKNIDLVLAAAQELPHIRFIIAGDGPLRSMVEEAAKKYSNVDYRGWLQRDQVRAVLDECEMLLLPSSVEAFGTVALEAMARQRLVLMSQQCGFRDWPELAQYTFFIHDAEGLGAAIKRISLEPRSTRMFCAQQGRLAAQAYLQKTIDEWMLIFCSTCKITPPVRMMDLDKVS